MARDATMGVTGRAADLPQRNRHFLCPTSGWTPPPKVPESWARPVWDAGCATTLSSTVPSRSCEIHCLKQWHTPGYASRTSFGAYVAAASRSVATASVTVRMDSATGKHEP